MEWLWRCGGVEVWHRSITALHASQQDAPAAGSRIKTGGDSEKEGGWVGADEDSYLEGEVMGQLVAGILQPAGHLHTPGALNHSQSSK